MAGKQHRDISAAAIPRRSTTRRSTSPSWRSPWDGTPKGRSKIPVRWARPSSARSPWSRRASRHCSIPSHSRHKKKKGTTMKYSHVGSVFAAALLGLAIAPSPAPARPRQTTPNTASCPPPRATPKTEESLHRAHLLLLPRLLGRRRGGPRLVGYPNTLDSFTAYVRQPKGLMPPAGAKVTAQEFRHLYVGAVPTAVAGPEDHRPTQARRQVAYWAIFRREPTLPTQFSRLRKASGQ